ncbi:MAG: hypothetical protein ABSC91_07005 [Candidatus Bathyarchaeia archaeon]|jgi:hypothetical protein
METEENQHNTQLGIEQRGKLWRRAFDQMAIGSIILLWGCLLVLKQVGLIDENVITWPFPLTAFGILLIAGAIYRLHRSRCLSETT